MFAFGVLSPLHMVFELSTQTTLFLYTATIVLAVAGMYLLLFRVSKMKIIYSVGLIFLLLPSSFLVVFPELIVRAMGSWVFDTDQVKYFNAWYAVVIACISFAWAYWDSHIQLQRYKEQPTDPVCFMTLHVFLTDYTFEAKEESRGIWKLGILIGLASTVMFCVFVLPTLSTNVEDIRIGLVKAAVMVPTGFLLGGLFLFLGQALHLIQLERKTGQSFEPRNFEERLRWRHDYVKYHLPAPIRKLNLRLFNQHVEAYERLQNEVKTSRT